MISGNKLDRVPHLKDSTFNIAHQPFLIFITLLSVCSRLCPHRQQNTATLDNYIDTLDYAPDIDRNH